MKTFNKVEFIEGVTSLNEKEREETLKDLPSLNAQIKSLKKELDHYINRFTKALCKAGYCNDLKEAKKEIKHFQDKVIELRGLKLTTLEKVFIKSALKRQREKWKRKLNTKK